MTQSRRKAREAALKALYQMDLAETNADAAIADMRAHAALPENLMTYAEQLVSSYWQNRELMDSYLKARTQQWDFKRLAAVDRSVLRMGCTELFYMADVPPAVTLNEAIELARKYSTEDSGRFVNGVLGAVLKESPKANWMGIPELTEEPPEPDPEPEVVEEVEVSEDEAQAMESKGMWTLRSDDSASG